jgi:hypothetical protein
MTTLPNQLPNRFLCFHLIGVVHSGFNWFQREKRGISVSAKMDILEL